MTEAELYEGLIGRDQEAFARLIDAYGASVYSLAARILSNTGTDQDVGNAAVISFMLPGNRQTGLFPEVSEIRGLDVSDR